MSEMIAIADKSMTQPITKCVLSYVAVSHDVRRLYTDVLTGLREAVLL